jgi:hypothetical protein
MLRLMVMKTRIFLVLITLSLLVILVSIRLSKKNEITNFEQRDSNWIIFRGEKDDFLNGYPYFITQINGAKQQFLGTFTGSPAFSNNSKYFAVGCPKDIDNICIYQTGRIPNRFVYPSLPHDVFLGRPLKEVKMIPVPDQCITQMRNKDENYTSQGISSLSWSPDDKSLLFLCIGKEISDVCNVNLDGESGCWERNINEKILNAEWSPHADEIVISKGDYAPLQITDQNGNILRSFSEGSGATWSPDGEQLAFISIDKNMKNMPNNGLAIINKDGSGFRWLIIPGSMKFYNDEFFAYIDDFTYYSTRLSWSKDGKNIAITVRSPGMYSKSIFIYDLQKNILTKLFDPLLKGQQYDPDWGQFNLQE